MTETRDVTVGSSVQRHQLRQYLRGHGIEWTDRLFHGHRGADEVFTITATPAQWEGINQWLQRTKVD